MSDLPELTKFKVVGTRPIRPDGVDKVTGKANFGADLHLPGMLIGKMLRSPHPHARIVSINTAKAMALPGVKAVVTSADLPDLASQVYEGGESASNVRDVSYNVLARGKVLYEGHAVAAVAAISPWIAEEAAGLIEVVYEVLPHVIDVEAAMAPDAPLLDETRFTAGLGFKPDKPSNIAKRTVMARGDLDAAFAEADVIVEGRYTTQPVHQGYIEPHACVASMSEDGQAHVWASSQGQFMIRTLCAKLLGLEIADIKVTPAEIGGGFGGKTTVYLEPVALALSRKAGAPVKMVMTRDEVFRGTGPTSGSSMYVKLGATRDGKLIAGEVEMKFQAGAFPGSPVGAACMTALSCYTIPAFKITGWDVVTNSPKVAAYRAPGGPIAAFAVESAADDLAAKLGMDPLAFRILNGVTEGAVAPYGATLVNIAYLQTLEAARNHPHYKAELKPGQGRGVAAGFWFNHGGESTAAVHISEDGGAVVVSSSPDIGGSRASMAMMAAEVLGLPIEKVRPVVGDTTSIGPSGVTGGSRVTFATGMAVTRAAEDVVEELKRRAALTWDVDPAMVAWRDGAALCLDASKDVPALSLAQLAANANRTGGTITAGMSLNAQGAAPAFAVHICDVEVDRETGHVTVLRYTALQDVGRAIHPSYVEGQLQGGAAQGIGWALNEEYIFGADGRMTNSGFLDYRMPVASDLPMIDTVLIEDVPNPRHPFGVKGVGEVPIVPPLAAVANAVKAATGLRMAELPISPPKMRAAFDAAGA
jgi:CO/xanthine dehydrogenase Mo-binding subunit